MPLRIPTRVTLSRVSRALRGRGYSRAQLRDVVRQMERNRELAATTGYLALPRMPRPARARRVAPRPGAASDSSGAESCDEWPESDPDSEVALRPAPRGAPRGAASAAPIDADVQSPCDPGSPGSPGSPRPEDYHLGGGPCPTAGCEGRVPHVLPTWVPEGCEACVFGRRAEVVSS